MVGAFLGLAGAVFTLFIGSLLGTLGALALAVGGEHRRFAKQQLLPVGGGSLDEDPEAEAAPPFLQTAIPFGPFLALAAGIFTLFQPALTSWYLPH
jgi:uncharacterized membrane protein HdeD (DUF308 family)